MWPKCKKKEEEEKFLIFPNPTSNIINIKVNDYLIKRIYLVDNVGRMIVMPKVNRSLYRNFKIDMNHLDKGVYFLVLNNNMYKIIKN
jgi:hypothetical protein